MKYTQHLGIKNSLSFCIIKTREIYPTTLLFILHIMHLHGIVSDFHSALMHDTSGAILCHVVSYTYNILDSYLWIVHVYEIKLNTTVWRYNSSE